MFCSQCGAQVKDGARFCVSCGSEIKVPVQEIQPVQPQPQQAVVAPKVPRAKGQSINKPIIAAAAVVAIAIVLGVSVGTGLIPLLSGTQAASKMAETPVAKSGLTTVSALERPTFLASVANRAEVTYTSKVQNVTVDSSLSNVVNLSGFSGIDSFKSSLAQNYFVIDASTGSNEFFDLYETNRYTKLASFVTVDSMMHTYHLYFQYLQKNTEKSALARSLSELSQAMLAESESYLDQLKGTEWESAAKRNVAFFAVGAALQDSSVEVPASVADQVRTELSRINSASEICVSTLFEDILEDYSQYKPRGYYEGDATLEPYFRAMMWYGRMNFKQSNEDFDRSAVLMALALEKTDLEKWESIYEVTSFFAGTSDDCTYYEYLPLVKAAYGDDVTAAKLAGNESAWKMCHELTASMSAPTINSSVLIDDPTTESNVADEKGYRFMGQRFSIDEAIFQELIYDSVGKDSSGQTRDLPNALDVPAALGSTEAYDILKSEGETDYEGYTENMTKVQEAYGDETSSMWSASLYARWLYTLNPLLKEKDASYPTFMQSQAWARKQLNAYLGSYTELKHDTVLYSKQVMAEMGGGSVNNDDRGYVEPEPEVYDRLSALCEATSEGLESLGFLSADDKSNLALLASLSDQLRDMSVKELQNEELSSSEYDVIRTFGGQLEHFWAEVTADSGTGMTRSQKNPAGVVVDVASGNGSCLELGTGKVAYIYVLVPINGELHLTRGAVYTFYQFEQPSSNRLTDSQWRSMMGLGSTSSTSSSAPSLEEWMSGLVITRR